MKGVEGNAALEPGFFDGRLLVEMLTWDGTLGIGLSPEGVPAEYRFQGGLRYSPGFEITGRVAAPPIWRDKSIRMWISVFGPEITFDVDDPMGVGKLYKYDPPHYGFDFGATLLVPKEALSFTATCLASVWKYIHVWTSDEDADEARITSFSFSGDIHKNLEAWIAGEAGRAG